MMTTSETENLNPLRIDGMKKENVEELRRSLHESIDSMFDSIEYDKDGDAVNRITAMHSKDFVRYPAMAEIDAFLPGTRKLEISVSATFRELQEEIERLKTGDVVKSALTNTAGYAVMRQAPPPEKTT
jgi:hypothetical protein